MLPNTNIPCDCECNEDYSNLVKGIMVRHKRNGVGMIVAFSKGWPVVRYETGYVYAQSPRDLIRGHYERKWVDATS